MPGSGSGYNSECAIDVTVYDPDTGCQLKAGNVEYDSRYSGLPCSNVQCAIDAIWNDGDPGPPGPTGPEGPQGEKGDQGEGIVYIGDATVAALNSVDPALMVINDAWILLDSGTLTAGTKNTDVVIGDTVVWVTDSSFSNLGQYEKGDTGDQGPQGIPGNDGTDGLDGADSTVPGPEGPIGLTGPQGPQGADSTVPGPEGPPGSDGADSVVPGPEGPQGLPGEVPEAPVDDIPYERKNAGWVPASGSAGDLKSDGSVPMTGTFTLADGRGIRSTAETFTSINSPDGQGWEVLALGASIITFNNTGILITRAIDFGAFTANNVGDPVAPQDAATKAYVDAAVAPLQAKIDALQAQVDAV